MLVLFKVITFSCILLTFPSGAFHSRLRKTNVLTPMVIHISVYSGHLSEGFSEKTPLATSVTERWFVAPGVQRVNVREKGVRGTLFLPPGNTIQTYSDLNTPFL